MSAIGQEASCRGMITVITRRDEAGRDEAGLLLVQLFELAANGGHGTVCMFGQTGSGEVGGDVALQAISVSLQRHP